MNPTHSPEVPELIITLSHHYRLLKDTCDNNSGNSTDAARGVIHNVLALLRKIEVQSVPGNERDLIYRLEIQCSFLDSLLRPKTDSEIIYKESQEAVEQLSYLLELVSIPWATAVETLCPPL